MTQPTGSDLGYGFCPTCGAPGFMRERRLNGNDRCRNGHEYPTRCAVHPQGHRLTQLMPYVQHMRECALSKPPHGDKCTCGLAELMGGEG